jgi:hypothetical protein
MARDNSKSIAAARVAFAAGISFATIVAVLAKPRKEENLCGS